MSGWRWRRLGAMSAAEIALRARRALRDRRDRVRFEGGGSRALLRSVPSPERFLADGFAAPWILAPASLARAARDWPAEATARAIAEADSVAAGRLRWLGAERAIGARPDWRADVVSGVSFPAVHVSALATASPEGAFDLKHVWEPNLHEAFVALAKAALLTGERRHLERLETLWRDWMEQNPFFAGPNYLAPIETGLRLAHWAATLRFWAAIAPPPRALLESIWEHVVAQRRHIAANLSLHSSANNHLIGELVTLHLADAAFPGLGTPADAARRRAALQRETLLQFAPDGGNREQALHYHAFSLALLLLARHQDRVEGIAWSDESDARLRAAADFLDAAFDAAGRPFLYGDNDDSEALPLAAHPRDPWHPVVAHARWLLDDAVPDAPDERTAWLLGVATVPPPDGAGHRALPSRVFAGSGHAFLRRGPIEVHLNGGPLGYLSIAAHGHADALALQMRYGGHAVVVDPGTFTYRGGSAWREWLVSSAAHATVTVDGVSPARRLGPFLWRDHYPLALDGHGEGWATATIRAGRDGRARLRRTVRLLDEATVVVEDALEGTGTVPVRLHWPFGEAGLAEDGGGIRISGPHGTARLVVSGLPGGGVLEKGDPAKPGTPCFSGSYDILIPGAAWTWSGEVTAPARWESRFVFADPGV